MIKVAPKLCSLIFLFVASLPLQAQPVSPAATAATDDAVREAVIRQADTITLHNKLALAKAAQQRKDLPKAAKLYEDCYSLVQKIGPGVEAESREVVNGLTVVLLDLSHQAQSHHDYKTADERLRRILVVDSGNRVVIDAKRENDKMIDGQAGRTPSPEVLDMIPTFRTNEIRVGTLVQDGKLLFEAGKLDQAEAKFEQANREDPQNVGAYYYMNLIKERRNASAVRDSELASKDGLLKVEKEWDSPLRRDQVQRNIPFYRNDQIYTGKGRQKIVNKLDSIRIDAIKYDGLPLVEVINNLIEITKTRDPERTGINFYISREAVGGAVAAATGAVDPTTGLPVAAGLPTEPVDVGAVTVKIALSDVRLADVLDAITKTSDKPIKYSIEDYSIVFSLKSPEPVPLFTRIFRVNPNTFKQGLEAVSGISFGDISTGGSSGGGGGGGRGGGGQGGQGGQGGSTTIIPRVNVAGAVTGGQGGQGGGAGGGISHVTRTNGVEEVNLAVRAFFTAAGVDFNPANPANVGKSLFFNDRKGTLMVHATTQDLDIIDKAIQTLNISPPQVNIKAKFVEITQNDSRAIGFDWFLGNVLLGGKSIAASGGTQPSFAGAPSTANPGGTFPGTIITSPDGTTRLVDTTQVPKPSDSLITSGLRNALGAPAIGTLTGVLTDPQFRVAIHALQQRDGVDLLTAPDVTTESGRQAQMQAVDIQTIVTGVDVNTQGGNATPAGGVGGTVIQNTVPVANYTIEPLPFGPVLDVIPYVSADEYSVQMTIIPTVTEFIGYDNPGQFVPQAAAATASGTSLTAQLPLPHFRMRQVTTSVTVWDAQTVVLGGLITDSVSKVKDKIPLLGDMPLLGRFFRSESSSKTKKNLIIFVTPTIINPDGSRYHTDDEMPFNVSNLPPQRPVLQ
ncbi:MAG: Type and secretion system protein [Pedosphaera sp.]|nr:Type and secretion system protein [Pedosphaera sp.]